jgi:DNA polymerase V
VAGYPGHLAQVCNLGALSEADRLQALAATEVGNVWGVGRKIGARLVEGGVRTVLDQVRCDVATLSSSARTRRRPVEKLPGPLLVMRTPLVPSSQTVTLAPAGSPGSTT